MWLVLMGKSSYKHWRPVLFAHMLFHMLESLTVVQANGQHLVDNDHLPESELLELEISQLDMHE